MARSESADLEETRKENVQCPECGRELGTKDSTDPDNTAHAEMIRFDVDSGEVGISVEFECADCGEELLIEDVWADRVERTPDRSTYRFDGDGHRV